MKNLLTLFLILISSILCTAQIDQNWEDNTWIGNWIISNGIWEVGTPTSGPNSSYQGTKCLATALAGNYVENTESLFESPLFQVPDISESPRLRFWHWYSFAAGDFGQVQIKPEGGNWEALSSNYINTSSSAWTTPSLDLKDYAGQMIQIGFFFHSENAGGGFEEVSSGWYIDDVEIVTGDLVFNNPETFENGIGDWYVDAGTWEVGDVFAYEGQNATSTYMGGNYHENVNSRLVSPPVDIPQAGESPRLRFWHWYNFAGGDYGQVQVKPEGGTWEAISFDFTNTSSSAWTTPSLDLEAYAGQTVQIGFFFHSENAGGGFEETNWGWSIDSIAIVTGDLTFNNPETFEDGIGDWYVDAGTWEVGDEFSYEGQYAASTYLGGNYHENVNSRLVSPPVEIPQATDNPRLRFWHWYNFAGGDYGQIQVKPEGGIWEAISSNYTNTSSSAWTPPLLDLKAYAGQTVQIGFFFHSENAGGGFEETNWGWSIDSIAIVTGDLVFNNPETFENGIGDWYSDAGTWGVGGSFGYESPNAAATNLDGNYHENVNSRLVSPPVEIPQASETPRLRFWHWYSFAGGDYGQVQVRPEGGNWEILSSEYTNTSSNAWSFPLLDLSGYAGQTVQIGFFFHSENAGGGFEEVSSGWYVDDVEIVTGDLVFNNPETFENGIGDWHVDAGTWEIGDEFAYQGLNAASTYLGGNYHENVNSRLVSPPVEIPQAGETPRLRFWHWYNFAGGDYGQVQVKPEGGAWEAISSNYTNTSSSAWTTPSLDLSAYAGQTVQLGFFFHSENAGGGFEETNWGWSIDSIAIVTGDLVFDNPETFEDGIGDWYVDAGTWEVGDEFAYEGQNAASTYLGGNYHENVNSRLVSPPVEIPQAGETPRLRFWHWYNFAGGDYGQVQVKPEGGTWEAISSNYINTSSNAWTIPSLDLSAYAGQMVQIGFFFHSENAGGGFEETNWGWSIDSIAIVTGDLVFDNPETFEDGIGDWYVDAGTWEVGDVFAYEGQIAASTHLGGNYHENVNSRLVSPPVEIPQAGETPRLRFWHWYNFAGGDYGQVQVKPEGGTWEAISSNYTNTSSSAWTTPSLDLAVYAGQTVQIAFFFHSENAGGGFEETNWGWSIDSIAIVTGDLVFNNPETFEDGIGDWYVDAGTWEVGDVFAYEGQNAASTYMGGNYHENVNSRLVSPPVEIPQAGETPRLRFWHWYNFAGGDYGQVQVRPEGGTWETLSTNYTNTSSSVWSTPSLDLNSYAGQTVQIGFFFHSENAGGGFEETNWGWSIDSIAIVTGDLVFNSPEDFENGIGDWFVENGTWEVGIPTVGPDSTYSGENCPATVLNGNYHENVNSRLVTVPFPVPDTSANPRIRFWHWYNFAAGDTGFVEIKVDTGDWQTILGPYTGNSDNRWRRPFYDLTPHIGSNVQVAFRFKSINAGGGFEEVSSGWYIDDFVAQDFLTLPPPEIRINKTGTTPVPGRTIDFFILVENIGDATANDIEVSELLEGAFTLQSLSPPAASDFDSLAEASIALWVLPELPPGDEVLLSYSAELNTSVEIGSTVMGGPACTFRDWLLMADCIAGVFADLAFGEDCDLICFNPCKDIADLANCLSNNGGNILECLDFVKVIKECRDCFPACTETTQTNLRNCLYSLPNNLSSSCSEWLAEVLGAIDPNEKVVTSKKYIKSDQNLVYSIHFENLGNAEAIDVFVTDTLSNNLDLSTLEILTLEGVSVDTLDRIIKWDLLDINLQPGETDNVLFSINPIPGLPSGTEIWNNAEIRFEVIDTISTNEVINIIDNQRPVSQMNPLPPVTPDSSFSISWIGVDSIGEIDNYTIFVSVDGSGYTEHFLRLHDTTAIFRGEAGKTYSFISIAEDVAGNIEEKLQIAEATTFIDPSVSVIYPEGDNSETVELLGQNFPNPFNTTTSIEYFVINSGKVKLEVYDVYGSKVRTLVDANQSRGNYSANWDGRNSSGVKLNEGMYFYRLVVDGYMAVKKMVFTR